MESMTYLFILQGAFTLLSSVICGLLSNNIHYWFAEDIRKSKINKHAKKYIQFFGLFGLVSIIIFITAGGVFIAYKLSQKSGGNDSLKTINSSLTNISQDCTFIKNSLQKKSIIVVKTYLPSGIEFKEPEVQELEQK